MSIPTDEVKLCPMCQSLTSEFHHPDDIDMEYFGLWDPICEFCYDMNYAGILEMILDEDQVRKELNDGTRSSGIKIA